jgi:hypothetical protein
MRNGSLAGNIADWLALVGRVPSNRYQGDIFRIAPVFAELAGTVREWRQALKEVDMLESQVIKEWTKEAREEERVLVLRATLLRLAEKRFKGELTDEDRQMMSTQDSPLVLSEWFNAAVDSDDYATFLAVLRR